MLDNGILLKLDLEENIDFIYDDIDEIKSRGYILIGVGNGAYEIFDNVAIYEASKEKLQTSYVTFERFIEGIVTSLLPILSYTILAESDNIIKITFGVATIAYLILGVYYGRTRIKE